MPGCFYTEPAFHHPETSYLCSTEPVSFCHIFRHSTCLGHCVFWCRFLHSPHFFACCLAHLVPSSEPPLSEAFGSPPRPKRCQLFWFRSSNNLVSISAWSLGNWSLLCSELPPNVCTSVDSMHWLHRMSWVPWRCCSTKLCSLQWEALGWVKKGIAKFSPALCCLSFGL